jgi:hypothetical protein
MLLLPASILQQAIQGCNQALDEQCHKLMLKPYLMFKFGQGKESV